MINNPFKLFTSVLLKKTLFLVLFVLNISFTNLIAQQTEKALNYSQQDSFFNQLYNFSFIKADSFLNLLDTTNYNIADINLMNSINAWWMVLSGKNVNKNIKSCNDYLDQTINYLNQKDNIDYNTQISLISAYTLKARLNNHLKNKIKTLSIFYSLLNRVNKLNPPIKKGNRELFIFGLYYYFVDYIENNYLFANVFLLKYKDGNKKLGIKYLEECTNSNDIILKTEANYFLFKIYFEIENNYSLAYQKINILHSLYPNNLVYSLELYKNFIVLNKMKESKLFKLKIIKEINNSKLLEPSQKKHFLTLMNEI